MHRNSCKQLTNFILPAPYQYERLGCTPLVLRFLVLKRPDEDGHGLGCRGPPPYSSVQRAAPFRRRKRPATESLLDNFAGPRGRKTLHYMVQQTKTVRKPACRFDTACSGKSEFPCKRGRTPIIPEGDLREHLISAQSVRLGSTGIPSCANPLNHASGVLGPACHPDKRRKGPLSTLDQQRVP